MSAPSDDIIGYFFTTLGIPRLRDTIDTGRLADVVEPVELAAYTRIALYRIDSGDADALSLARHFVQRLAVVLSGDEAGGYREIDGEPALECDEGPMLVLERHLRHWEWMACLLADPTTAAELLSAVPASMRREAEETIESNFDNLFNQMVAML